MASIIRSQPFTSILPAPLNASSSTPAEFFKAGKVPNSDPLRIDQDLIKFGIHSKQSKKKLV